MTKLGSKKELTTSLWKGQGQGNFVPNFAKTARRQLNNPKFLPLVTANIIFQQMVKIRNS